MQNRMLNRPLVSACLVLVLSLTALLGACAKPAPSPAPAPAPKTAPAPAPAPKASPLDAIIEGAKKEGTVSFGPTAGFDAPKVVEALKKAIKDKYGVDLDMKVQATAGMAGMIAKAIMETKSGAEPTYDAIVFSDDYIPRTTKEGIVEMVDWRSLFQPGTPREAQYEHPQLKAGVVVYSGTHGFMYNPQKIPAAEVPRKLADLADPKWKGRVGIHDYNTHWARYAFILGKDKTLATLRSIITANRPIMDRYPPMNNRYLAGELDLAYTVDQYVEENRGRGKPTAWANMEMLEMRNYQLVVMKGAKHPNAAKLLGVFLATPEGAKFTIDVAKKSHHLYPGNTLYDAVTSAKKDNIPIYTWETFPGLLDFILSPTYDTWQKEVQLILDTAK